MYKIKSLHIENVRAIKSATVRFADSITVLIGENGAGKSTILECLEILRKIPSGRFVEDLYEQHGGVKGLLRKGEDNFTLKVLVEHVTAPERGLFGYRLHMRAHGEDAHILFESVIDHTATDVEHDVLMDRDQHEASVYIESSGEVMDVSLSQLRDDAPLLMTFATRPPNAAVAGVIEALRRVEVQLRFDTLARWAAVATAAPSPLRGSSQVRPTNRLDLLGRNLANAWRVLLAQRVGEAFDHVMYLVRMGLGEDVERVEIVEDPSGGQVGLALRRAGLPEPIQAFMLSDGQLAWLAFVAMVQLNEGRSILAVDEPELHMHPYLINAAVALLQTVAAPVVIATHSDHILSMLEDPVAAVRVCALEDGAAVVRELDAAAFEEWRKAYTDMGQLRASGFLEHVLKREE